MHPSRILALSALVLILVVPMSVLAGSKHHVHHLATKGAGDDIVFGITGGNIMPYVVTIEANGTIVAKGRTVQNQQLTASGSTLGGLEKLADTEGFWSMPARTNCSGTLPDVASSYITINSTSGSKAVTVHGGCVARFNQLYGVLTNVVAIQY